MARLLSPEEIAALLAEQPLLPAPRERYRVVVEAGRTELAPEEIAALRPGTVVPLTRAVDGPVEIVANAVVVAYGELIDLDGRAAVRVVSLPHPSGTSGRTSR
ncbi:MAG: FliM/FliN family flagellar motor C-terminal domain-containing protein [Hyphomicrobiales bacterium]